MPIAAQAPAHIRAISPYQPGKPIEELARELGLDPAGIIKLASNENPLGMSPAARAAAATALDEVPRYPDGNGYTLKQALVRRYGVKLEQIVLGNGSNDVLELVARAFLAPGRSAVYAQHAFAVYPLATQAMGAQGIEVPARDYGHDLSAMRAAIRDDTRVVWLANPNNPTGTFHGGAAIEAFLDSLPPDLVVVLDEAYTEYLSAEQRYDSIAWLQRYPNLLVCRTFSKAYGLAGLRVGFGLGGAELIDLLNRVRQPFNVSGVALAAAAAALEDRDFVERSFAANRAGMAQLEAGFAKLGLRWIPSAGNFIAVEVGDAAAINRRLLAAGVIVRPVTGYGMPRHLRVSIGLPEENARLLDSLSAALGAAA
ncbi:MAG: histidinol-phosphate transaminase [Rhodocyclaceae bacterium]|nr:histidinol-phosphate transaminase [Rhodocyclaceae bacterium]MBX3670251.1 histidinol-phosphate transaminase [Rhodocyclaceae bacterium]